VTTAFEPSEAVHRQVRMKDWCLVVVGDRKSPKKYETNWIQGEGNDAVVYLSPEDQESMHNIFVSSLPWNHFGRKNVGYMKCLLWSCMHEYRAQYQHMLTLSLYMKYLLWICMHEYRVQCEHDIISYLAIVVL